VPGNKRALQPAARTDDAPVKPKPPKDLWERMAEIEPPVSTTGRPEGVFTAAEYAERRKISQTQARVILKTLHAEGKLERVKFRVGQWPQWGYSIPEK
jgi:hypothetical protein